MHRYDDVDDHLEGDGVIVRGLCRGYGDVPVIADLNLTVRRRSIYGPSLLI